MNFGFHLIIYFRREKKVVVVSFNELKKKLDLVRKNLFRHIFLKREIS